MQYEDGRMGNARNILCNQIFSVKNKKSLNPNLISYCKLSKISLDFSSVN